MASNAVSAVGVVIKRGDGASVEAFTTIAEVNGIVGYSAGGRRVHEVTTLDSPSGVEEFVKGFRTAGTFTLNMNYTRNGLASMEADRDDNDLVNYRIVLADATATQYDFAAGITDITVDWTPTDRVTMNVTFQKSGPTTLSS